MTFLDDIDRLFEQLVRSPWSRSRPAAEPLRAPEMQVELQMPLSGAQLSDVSISVQERQLIVRTRRGSVPGGEAAGTPERAQAEERVLVLPEAGEVSAIEAQIIGEVLHVRVRLRPAAGGR